MILEDVTKQTNITNHTLNMNHTITSNVTARKQYFTLPDITKLNNEITRMRAASDVPSLHVQHPINHLTTHL